MSSSTLPRHELPPAKPEAYLLPQLSGEKLTIPGSKGVFRILSSSLQTNGTMSVFTSGGTVADAPGFHLHHRAHDYFLVTKGYLQLWNGDKCRILGPGDFGSVPPNVIHNPWTLGPHTETLGLVTPGDWIDFFRYVGDSFDGILVPESDDRNLKALLMPKIMAAMQAKKDYDVVFQREYEAPPLGEWDADDEKLPEGVEPYFLKRDTGPRWMAGGVLSRPFVTTVQNGGTCAISSIESSEVFGEGAGEGKKKGIFSTEMVFEKVDHVFCVFEGALVVVRGGERHIVREGETAVIPRGENFALEFESRFVRFWSFASGDGIETLVHKVGKPLERVTLPDQVSEWEESKLEEVAKEIGVKFV